MYEGSPSRYRYTKMDFISIPAYAGKGGDTMGIYVKLLGAALLAFGALSFSGVIDGGGVATPSVDPMAKEVVNINSSQAEAIRKVDEKLAEGDRIIAERRAANATRNAATAAWVDAPTSPGRSSTYTGGDNSHIVGEVNRSMSR